MPHDLVPEFGEDDIIDWYQGVVSCICGAQFMAMAPSNRAIVPCFKCAIPCEVDLNEFVVTGTAKEAFDAVGLEQ